jgi:NADH dehydrogenase (ubiquinone) Fe-S protein 1
MDAVGSNIVICQRSGDLLRIIPRIHEEINEEWLADKSRYAPVDGLKRQRLTVPLLRPSSDSHLQECDWEDALIAVSQAITHCNPSRVVSIVGPHTDAETMVSIKDFLNLIGSENIFVNIDSQLDFSAMPKSKDIDFRHNYLFNTGIANTENSDFVLLVATNPRFEAPLLNARIRKAWRENWLNDIALIGPKQLDLLYNYEWLGDDVNILHAIAAGKHPIVSKIENSKNPMIILGQQVIRGNQLSNAYDLVKYISQKYKIQFNLLHSNASQVAAFDLGLKPASELILDDNGEPAVIWLFGVDDDNLNIPKNCFVIFQVYFK